MIFHLLETSNKNTDSQPTIALLVEHVNASRTILRSKLVHSVLFGQNLGISVSFEWIARKVRLCQSTSLAGVMNKASYYTI